MAGQELNGSGAPSSNVPIECNHQEDGGAPVAKAGIGYVCRPDVWLGVIPAALDLDDDDERWSGGGEEDSIGAQLGGLDVGEVIGDGLERPCQIDTAVSEQIGDGVRVLLEQGDETVVGP